MRSRASRALEFVWVGADLGHSDDSSAVRPRKGERRAVGTPRVIRLQAMFTHVMHTHYSAIKGFDWEDSAQRVMERNEQAMAEQLRRRGA